MPDLSNTVAVRNFTGWVYDPGRRQIEIVTSDGKVLAYGVDTQQLTTLLEIGGSPIAAALSPDGRYLVVANRDPILTSSPFAVTQTFEDQVTRIDLTDLSVKQVRLPSPDRDEGLRDITVTSNGLVMVSGDVNGSSPIRGFNVANPDTTYVPSVFSLNVAFRGQVSDNSQFVLSDGGQYVLVQEGNSTPGTAYLYSVALGDGLMRRTDPHNLGTGALWGGGDISETRQLIVNVAEFGVHAFDLQLFPVANLSS